MTALPAINENPNPWKAALAWGASLALALRVGLGMIMGTAWLTVEADLPSTLGPSVYGELQMPTSRLGAFFLGVWPRWDAVHHLNLAMRGYFALSPGDSVFYPLYAGLTRFIALHFGGNFILAGLVVSTVSAAVAFTLLFLLGSTLFGPSSGKWAAIGLAVYPTAVFLVAPFTESLFLALTLGALYLAYRGKWLPAAIPALLASLTRGPGIFLGVPLAIIATTQFVRKPNRRSLHFAIPALAAIGAPIAGGLAFLVWRSLAGFPPMTVALREYSRVSFVDPFTGLTLAIRQWVAIFDLPTTLDTVSAIFFLTITGLMAINPRWRKPELLAYMLVSLAFLLSVKAEAATSLKGLSRYVLALFPAFLVLGDYLATAQPKTRFIYLVTSSTLLLALSALYAIWFFIG